MSRQTSACVANSLGWYEAMLRPHGVAGAITSGVWAIRQRVPPYYSNAITVDTSDPAAQTAVLRDLAKDLNRPFSVKYSFAALELAPLGFRPLFDAEWMWRDPSPGPPADGRHDLEWRRVTDLEELDQWEAAWRSNGSPADTRVFLPELLAPGDVVLLAGRRGDRIDRGLRGQPHPRRRRLLQFLGRDADGSPSWRRPSARSCSSRRAPGRRLRQRRRPRALQAAGLSHGRRPPRLARRVAGVSLGTHQAMIRDSHATTAR